MENEDATGIGGSFAAHDGDVIFFREGVQAVVNFSDEFRRRILGQKPIGNEGGGGRASHGGDVAKAAGEGFVANFFRRRFVREMHAFDDGVGLEQKQFFRQAEIEHGAVVARAGHDGFIRGQRFRERGDEFEFVQCG